MSTAALPLLRKSSNAAIVNTCSVVATVGLPKRAIYSASKGAILSLTLAMVADLLSEKIRVNCLNPGLQKLLSIVPVPLSSTSE